MKEHYYLFLDKAELPAEAVKYLSDCGKRFFEGFEKELIAVIDEFYGNDFNIKIADERLLPLAEASGIHIYTVNFIFLVAASERMLADYRKAALGDELFWDTIMDIKYKLFECHTVMKVWGNFVEHWYPIFYRLDLFKLGRLEFERIDKIKLPGDKPIEVHGYTVNPGDRAFSVHIPSCGPLTRELRIDSYKRAYNFFEKEREGKPLVCFCESWLLNPDNRKIFPPHLNIIDFMSDWFIFNRFDDPEYNDAWRIFGQMYKGNTAALPQDTTPQRSMVRWLQNGGIAGCGEGLLIFGGEKILS